jgi:hypothetical protein
MVLAQVIQQLVAAPGALTLGEVVQNFVVIGKLAQPVQDQVCIRSHR